MGKGIEYKMVDLGLPSGLKWADRNVGAVNVQDYGDYFMWGSTEPDTNNVCDWAHAPFNNGSSYFDETYFNEHKSEWLTENGTLKSEYDAASVNMGDGWRMPTESEAQEFLDLTDCAVEEVNGVIGIRFTSKYNSNSIFMPFCGERYGSDIYSVGKSGHVWTSSLGARSVEYSNYFFFDYDAEDFACITGHWYGFAVRGVHA